MKSLHFDLNFEVQGKRMKASCQKFKMVKVPQIRVCFGEPLKEQAFTFYEINEPGQKYFWFNLPKPLNEIAKPIAKALARSMKAKVPVD